MLKTTSLFRDRVPRHCFAVLVQQTDQALLHNHARSLHQVSSQLFSHHLKWLLVVCGSPHVSTLTQDTHSLEQSFLESVTLVEVGPRDGLQNEKQKAGTQC